MSAQGLGVAPTKSTHAQTAQVPVRIGYVKRITAMQAEVSQGSIKMSSEAYKDSTRVVRVLKSQWIVGQVFARVRFRDRGT